MKSTFKNSYTVSVIEVTKTEESNDSSADNSKYRTFEDVEISVPNHTCTYSDSTCDSAPNVRKSSANVTDSDAITRDGSDFESAIAETKFGKYNIFLLFVTFLGYMSSMYSTTTMSLVLPSAECDLNLSNIDKGMLNSGVYIGMLFSGFFWGILADSLGRRTILMGTLAFHSVCSLVIGFAQNFTFLLVAKILSGFVNSSTIAIFATFVAENHSVEHRASITVGIGSFVSIANITLPLLAWLIIPTTYTLVLFDGYLYLSNWRLFLLVSALPSLLAFVCIFFISESPKFLMFQNRLDEALSVFRRIYAMNTGNPPDTYPIKTLLQENSIAEDEVKGTNAWLRQIIQTSRTQVLPIFRQPYLLSALLPCTIFFLSLLGVNTLRLWSPQLFASVIESEKVSENRTDPSTICDVLAANPRADSPAIEVSSCTNFVLDDQIYINSMITGLVTGVGYLISGYLVKILDRKWLQIFALLLGCVCSVALYWCTTSTSILAVISIFIAVVSTASTARLSAVIDIFPTFLRTTALGLCLTFGRFGAVVGNLLFPILLDWNCGTPFMLLAIVLPIAACLSMRMPLTKGKHLE